MLLMCQQANAFEMQQVSPVSGNINPDASSVSEKGAFGFYSMQIFSLFFFMLYVMMDKDLKDIFPSHQLNNLDKVIFDVLKSAIAFMMFFCFNSNPVAATVGTLGMFIIQYSKSKNPADMFVEWINAVLSLLCPGKEITDLVNLEAKWWKDFKEFLNKNGKLVIDFLAVKQSDNGIVTLSKRIISTMLKVVIVYAGIHLWMLLSIIFTLIILLPALAISLGLSSLFSIILLSLLMYLLVRYYQNHNSTESQSK